MRIEGTNLHMIRGDTEYISITVEKEDESYLEDGDMLYLTVKKNTRTTEVELQKILTSFPNGRAIFEIKPSDTKGLATRRYKYDIQLTKQNGEVKTLVAPSEFVIEPEVTYD